MGKGTRLDLTHFHFRTLAAMPLKPLMAYRFTYCPTAAKSNINIVCSINQSINQTITTYKSDQWCTTHLKTKIKPKDNVQKSKNHSEVKSSLKQ